MGKSCRAELMPVAHDPVCTAGAPDALQREIGGKRAILHANPRGMPIASQAGRWGKNTFELRQTHQTFLFCLIGCELQHPSAAAAIFRVVQTGT